MTEHIGNHIHTLFNELWEKEFLADAEGSSFTYKTFYGHIIKTKELLIHAGVRKGDRVCLILDNSYGLLVHYFALLSLEAVAVPVEPRKGSSHITNILEVVNPVHVVDSLTEFSRVLETEELPQAIENIWSHVDFSKLYLITFTSGTTGKPKGVCHSFQNLFETALAFRDMTEIKKGTSFAHVLPMTYMAGILNSIFLPFLTGCRIVLFERFSVANCSRFWENATEYSIKNFWITPTIASLLLKLDRGNFGIRFCHEFTPTIFVGTAPLYEEVKEQFEMKYSTPLWESYGLSETLFVTTNSSKYPVKVGSVGRALNGVTLSLAKDREIEIQTPWNFLGYWGDDSTFAQVPSGDFGSLDEQGYLFIEGRKKELIIRGGVNISPFRIENFIHSSKLLDGDVAVIGVPDFIMGEKTVCFYTATDVANEDLKALNKGIIETLGTDSTVDRFIYVKELPRNNNSKVDKGVLLQSIQERSE